MKIIDFHDFMLDDDGRTDIVSYRDARMHLKIFFLKMHAGQGRIDQTTVQILCPSE